MESPLDDFPSEPIANSSGSTSNASQNPTALIEDSITRTRRSNKPKGNLVAALRVSLRRIRAASLRVYHKSDQVTKLVGPLLHRLPAALNRPRRTTPIESPRVESPRADPRALRSRASRSLADEIAHIAHDAGLTQEVAVQSLQRAVAETVQREAARLNVHDHDGTPPRVLAVVVAAALIAGVIFGIMRQRPWSTTPAASVGSSGVAAAAPSLRDTVPVDSVAPLPKAARSSDERAQAASIAQAGQLRIVTDPPAARVTVNGIGQGVTPLTIRHLPPGAKRLRVTKDGYAGAERVISLAEGDVGRTVRIRLARMR